MKIFLSKLLAWSVIIVVMGISVLLVFFFPGLIYSKDLSPRRTCTLQSGDMEIILLDAFVSEGDLIKMRVEFPNGYVDIRRIRIIPDIVGWEQQIVYKKPETESLPWGETITEGHGSGDNEIIKFRIPNDLHLDGTTADLKLMVDYICAEEWSYKEFVNNSYTESVNIPVIIYSLDKKESLIKQHGSSVKVKLIIGGVYLFGLLILLIFYILCELRFQKRSKNLLIIDASDYRIRVVTNGISISLTFISFFYIIFLISSKIGPTGEAFLFILPLSIGLGIGFNRSMSRLAVYFKKWFLKNH